MSFFKKKEKKAELPLITAVNSIVEGSYISSSAPPSEDQISLFKKVARDHPDELFSWIQDVAPEYFAKSRMLTQKDERIMEVHNYHGPVYYTIATGERGQATTDVQINYVKIIEPIINNIHQVIGEKPEYKEDLETLENQLKSASSKEERLGTLDSLRDWYETHKDELKDIAKEAILEIVKTIGTIAMAG